MKRYNFLRFIFLILSLTFLTRLFYWQVIKGESLSVIADNEHSETIELQAKRGIIKDRNNYSLVGNKTDYLLFADLNNLKEDPEEISKKLAHLIIPGKNLLYYQIEEGSVGGILVKEELPKDQVLEEKLLAIKYKEKLSLKDLNWISLENRISEETKISIEKSNITGLGFEQKNSRNYPESSTAAHILGFVGSDSQGAEKGYFGLEGFYDRELKGRNGTIKRENDVSGRPILLSQEFEQKAENGRDLILTIDRSIQFIVEKHLLNGINKWQAIGGSVTVIDPYDGSIIAMASFPNYNPSSWQNYGEAIFKNPVVADTFEPGSIMKPLVMSAALNEGKVKPDTKCPICAGPRQIGDYSINTFNFQYHPNLTMTEVLVNSDNTGMIFVGEKLGFEKFYFYLEKYGFGKRTGIDLQDEETGVIRSKKDWKEIDLATATFGQGIAVTQIQILRGFAALANGGYLVTPHLVKETTDGKKVYPVKSQKQTRILKETTSNQIKEMLIEVSEKSPLRFPLALHPDLKNYRIAAKSGTAQVPIAGHYDAKTTTASVVGFAPADKPKFLILVRLIQPQVRIWGSDTAGPIFYDIVDDLIKYYAIPPRN